MKNCEVCGIKIKAKLEKKRNNIKSLGGEIKSLINA